MPPARLACHARTGSPARPAAAVVGFERGGDGADEPGVDRKPVPGGRLLDTRPEVFGDAQRDPRGAPLLRGGVRRVWRYGWHTRYRWHRRYGWRGSPGIDVLGRLLVRLADRRWRHHEVGVAAAQAYIDRAWRQLAG